LQSDKIIFTSHVIDTSFDVSILQSISLDALLLMSFCLSNDLSVLNTQELEQIRNAFLSRSRAGEGGSRVIDEQMEVFICQA